MSAPLFLLAAAVIAAVGAAHVAVVAAAAEQQNQNDDPPAVAATETVVAVTHRDYLRDEFSERFAAHSMVFPRAKKVRQKSLDKRK